MRLFRIIRLPKAVRQVFERSQRGERIAGPLHPAVALGLQRRCDVDPATVISRKKASGVIQVTCWLGELEDDRKCISRRLGGAMGCNTVERCVSAPKGDPTHKLIQGVEVFY